MKAKTEMWICNTAGVYFSLLLKAAESLGFNICVI